MARKIRIKTLIFILSAVIAIIILLLFFIGSFMTDVSIKRSSNSISSIHKSLKVSSDSEQKKSEEEALAKEKDFRLEADKYLKDLCEKNPGLYYTKNIKSFDGLKLNAHIFIQPEYSSKWALIVHGYHGLALNNSYFIQEYYKRGFNVIAPDMRAHGQSEGKWIGMGCTDRYDLISWLKQIVEKDKNAQILMHGFSMGASAIMMAAGEEDFPEQVKVCIEDAGYSSDWAELASKLKSLYKLPSFPVMNAANIMTRIKAGYYISDGDCVKSMKKNKSPFVFIHGEADDFNPYYMMQELFDACPAAKVKLSVPRARHCMSVYVDTASYWQTIWTFADNYL